MDHDRLAQDIASANHILAAQGVVDAFGHISARHPDRADRFFMARSVAPALVQADDILELDLDGNVTGARSAKTYLERFIHSEIYRARPDVMSVVHSHSYSVIPFGVTNVALRPICHLAGFIGDNVPIFDTHPIVGDSDLLISDAMLGRALTQCLDTKAAVLQRGHGSTVVGASIKQAVFRAIYLEVNARLQIAAAALGPITFLTTGEAALAAHANDGQIDRCWGMWLRSLPDTKEPA